MFLSIGKPSLFWHILPCLDPSLNMSTQNPTKVDEVHINVPTLLQLENTFFIIQYRHTENNTNSINGWLCWKVMKLGHSYMLRFKVNLGHFYWIDLGNMWEN